MIQDIKPYHLHNEFEKDKEPSSEDIVLVFRDLDGGKEILLTINGADKKIAFPRVKDIANLEKDNLKYVFNVGEEDFYLYQPNELTDHIADGYSFCDMKDVRKEFLYPKHYVYAIFTAFQLDEWYKVTNYCGKCGSKNEDHPKERARICPKCGNIIYPRINPAVIIGVTDKETNRIVLTKYRRGFALNALVAGFTEIGETLEETVQREVMEEIGLKVTNVRYYKSQPWGIASDILVGFYCDVTGDRTITMDESELKYAEWVSPSDIELQPLDYSLTNEMMSLFKEKGYEGTIIKKV
ncbi:MAG: NAD(+) diphosphatase [Butyrivibrio sp.]|jgi:NAD+ diphosphatase|uniref:NAD(+) diphosphatase n=1 Tax=Butyrivibrio sp. TaxID=28121 RepID=UPI001EB149A5|nr:NAD(+) diphosphatase [Butyrivibrio sp.]MBE5841376.1 NAD(+) diphosphatase [Butyrivibrio sp.]